MKKTSFTLGLLLLAGVFAAAEEQRPIDLVVVLDTSSSMYASYRDVSEYVVGPMLKEFLRVGDTFHLIGFSGAPRAEISRRVEGVGDVETIVGRMLLMYPLDPYSDVIAALEYVSRYLADLPDTRPKTIVFISDGEHAPSPSSTYAGLDAEAVKTRLAETTARLKGNGWTFHFLRVPFSGEGSLAPLPGMKSSRPQVAEKAEKGEPIGKAGDSAEIQPASAKKAERAQDNQGTEKNGLDVSDTVADLLAAPVVDWSAEESQASIGAIVGAIAVDFPKELGKSGRNMVIPLVVRNPSPKPVYLETQSIQIDGVDRMAKRSFRELAPRSEGTLKLYVTLPAEYPVGRKVLKVEPAFTGSVRISPQSGDVAVEIVEANFARFFSAALPALLFAVGLIAAALLAVLVIVLSRRMASAPGRVASHAASESRGAQEKRRSVAPAEEPRTVRGEAVRPASATAGRPSAAGDASAAGAPAAAPIGAPLSASPSAAAVPSKTAVSAGTGRANPPDDTAALLAGFASRSAADEASRNSFLAARSAAEGETARSAPPAPIPAVHAAAPAVRAERREAAPLVPYEVRKADARIMLSLFVEDQNTMIGRRNIHLVKAGSTLSIGGGNSDFLVFLVPVPRRIAEVRFDGEKCILVPRRPEFFPDIGAEPVVDCVGKTIRVVSQKGYELKIRLDRFQDPLSTLNRFLHSIDVPGR